MVAGAFVGKMSSVSSSDEFRRLCEVWYSDARAGLAELADAPDSKSGDRKVV
jgi:hypothetical protein